MRCRFGGVACRGSTVLALLVAAGGFTVRRAQWSAEQRNALAVLDSAVAALKQGKMDALAPLYHEKFVGWDLAQATPSHRESFLKEEAAFIKELKSFDSRVTPQSIQIIGPTAVLLAHYVNTVVMKDGERLVSKGRWSTTLVRQGRKWVFLSSAYIADR